MIHEKRKNGLFSEQILVKKENERFCYDNNQIAATDDAILLSLHLIKM